MCPSAFECFCLGQNLALCFCLGQRISFKLELHCESVVWANCGSVVNRLCPSAIACFCLGQNLSLTFCLGQNLSLELELHRDCLFFTSYAADVLFRLDPGDAADVQHYQYLGRPPYIKTKKKTISPTRDVTKTITIITNI